MAKAKGVVYQPFHSSNDPDPTPPPVPPKPPSRRRSISNRARQLFGLGSGDNAAGQRRSVDGVGTNMRRMWSRSGSTPPDTRNRDHRLQDGDTIFSPVSANASRAYAEERANKMLGSGRNEGQIQAHFRVSSEVDLSGRPLRDDKDRGRSRHRDATRSSPAPPAPPPKPGFSPSSPTKSPVIPPRPTAKPMEPTARKLRKPVPQERRPKILFYHKTEPYYGFTNFSPHPVDYRGKRYPTSEHLFQSFKFSHKPTLMEHIRTCDPRPSVAFSEARRFADEVHPSWRQDNIRAMEVAISLKFAQHRSLRNELLGTGDAELIENSDKDAFWGCGADGRGRNELGKALMRLRRQLRERGRG